MSEPNIAKAIVKLPKKSNTNTNRQNQIEINETANSTINQGDYEDYLVSEKLYLENLPDSMNEIEILELIQSCDPLGIHFDNNLNCAYIQFQNKHMADYAFTLFNGSLTLKSGYKLQFKVYPPSSHYVEPEATAEILQIKHLPNEINNNKALYELFRPFGPMIVCKVLVEQDSTFKGSALVQYFNPENANHAENIMNNTTVQDNVISVIPFVSSKTKETTTRKPDRNSFVATEVIKNTMQTPVIETSYNSTLNRNNESSIVDYTNLYIKNLDLNVKSADLFSNFQRFGKIISARVMKNTQTKQSKGFGFVSFSKPDEALQAKQEMNNTYILSKPIIVAFHEPKKSRENDTRVSPDASLRQPLHVNTSVSPLPLLPPNRYPRPNSVTSPVPNYTAEQQKPNSFYPHKHHSSRDNMPLSLPKQDHQNDLHRPSSNNTHFVGNPISIDRNHPIANHYPLNNPLNIYDQRQLSNHQDAIQNRKSYEIPYPHQQQQQQQQTQQTQSQTQPQIQSQPQPVHQPPQSQQQQVHQQQKQQQPINQQQQQLPLKRVKETNGLSYQPTSLTTLASGVITQTPPPMTIVTPDPRYHIHDRSLLSPVSQYKPPGNKPTFRRRGSVESITSVMTKTSSQAKRQTILKAVLAVEKDIHSMGNLHDIVDMILTLKKKDLATCLFNKVFLKSKIKQAKDALDIFEEEQQDEENEDEDEEDEPEVEVANNNIIIENPLVTPYYHHYQVSPPITTIHKIHDSKISRAIPIVPPSSLETERQSPKKPKVSTNILDRPNNDLTPDKIDSFLLELKGLQLHEQKQRLGDRLFPLVKSTGVKHAPRVTIKLLDSIPLNDLAHSMYEIDKLKNHISQITPMISTKY